jgi:DNA-binding MarR family transcriptional regulator
MALGFLEKRRLAVVEPNPAGGRGKVVRLTPSGRDARDAYGACSVS